MNTLIIVCEMIRKEIEHVLKDIPFDGDIIWKEKKLHEYPEKLRSALQEEIDRNDMLYDNILLVYGLCGNGLLGLHSSHARLIIPKFDDCIRIMLSSGKNEPILSSARSLYYTEGWLDAEDNLMSENGKYIQQYGWEKGTKLLRIMFKNYRDVAFLDTGLYDISLCEEQVRKVREACHMECRRTPGSLRVYEKMIRGEWDEEFIISEPGNTVTYESFADRPRCIFPDEE